MRLFLVGDSTMASKRPPPDNPERGWGEALAAFFTDAVAVENRALNGRSTVSFRSEGHWDKVLAQLRPGDSVLIQFGHNDAKSEDPARHAPANGAYQENLRLFIDEVHARDGHVIVATSIVRRRFEGDALLPTHGDYPAAARAVAAEAGVPLIDLNEKTRELVEALGPEKSKALYLWTPPLRYPRFPDGAKDDTHFSAYGAAVIAQLAAEEIQFLETPISAHLKQPQPDFREIRWRSIHPEGTLDFQPGNGEEKLENSRVSNVHVPAIAFFPSFLGEAPRPTVIVCPGGGYARLAIEHEGVAVARWLNSIGVNAFLLKYRLKEYGYPAPFQDVLQAIRTVREEAEMYAVERSRIGVLGFSAGGHLAGMAATLWDSGEAVRGDTGAVSARPDFAVMVYPVVTLQDPDTHRGSRRNLLGEHPDEALVTALSLENQVTARTPPVFLLHGASDTAVSARNSLLFADALREQGIPFALHIFPEGPHGFGMTPLDSPVDVWTTLLADWLEEREILR